MKENESFILLPYAGVNRASFGMTTVEIEKILGVPDRVSFNFLKQRVEYRSFMNVGYSKVTETANHFGFSRRMKGVKYNDIFLFLENEKTVIKKLITEDGNPFFDVGFIVLLNLGMTFTGFHDHDESQKAVTIFERGTWDTDIPNMKPFILTK